ncbi:MAG: HAMP domain-containing sensor histidine kinase [Bacillota bacterium]|nr:HAMP domain-containing sensor histidine kinase [Bacillota bacterium]
MKNRSLALKIWLVIAGVTLGISLLFMALVPWTLRNFFTHQMYDIIRESQELLLGKGQIIEIDDLIKWEQRKQQYQSVQHFVFLDNGQILSGYPTAAIQQNMEDILKDAFQQTKPEQQYWRQLSDERMYYIIQKGEYAGRSAYLLSYMWESYQNDLVSTLFQKLFWIIAALLVLSWLLAFWLARYLSRPLITMEEQVRRIASRDWFEPLVFDQNDEIGRLGQSIERMRSQLVKQDEIQQSFLQHISHELKTPVMVIRSYAQAIADGIFPRGGLEGSIQVIDEEASRLEKRIRDLLYLNKVDYLSIHQQEHNDDINLGELIENVVNLLRWQRPELEWCMDLDEHRIKGNYEQWKVAIENLLDNQIRYAENTVGIQLSQNIRRNENTITIRIWNDGPLIEEEMMDKLFQEYQIGKSGQFGLGLAIIQQVVVRHGGTITANNQEKGVTFYIELPEKIR